MSQINNYPIVNDIQDATFVVETSGGTRRMTFAQISAFFNNIVNEGGIGEALNKAGEALQTALSASNSAADAISRINDVIQKNIADAYIQGGHLYIQLVDETVVDCGIVIQGKEYGVCYDASTQSPTLERVGDAVGLQAGTASGSDTHIVNDFDNIYPWSHIKRCTISNEGVITSYQGDANYIEDGSIGQVMVEIPKFYIKRVTDNTNQKVYTYIAAEQLNGYRLPEAFKDSNGDEMDYIYIAAYPSVNDGTNLTNSIATKKDMGEVKNNYTNTMSRSLNRGAGWHNLTAVELCDVIQPLFIVEFATLNTQSVFYGGVADTAMYVVADTDSYGADKNEFTASGSGDLEDQTPFEDGDFFVGMPIEIWLSPNQTGYVLGPMDRIEGEGAEAVTVAIRKITHIVKDSETGKWTFTFDGSALLIDADWSINPAVYNGICNDIQASSGVLGDGYEGCVSFKWRGFENLYGNTLVWLGGILYPNNGNYFYNPDLNQQSETTTSSEPFVDTEIQGIKLNDYGYITKMSDSDDFPFLWLPVETGGSSDTAYCDEITKRGNTGTRGLQFGNGSLFGFAGGYANSNNSFNFAAGRLAYCRFGGGVGETSPTE